MLMNYQRRLWLFLVFAIFIWIWHRLYRQCGHRVTYEMPKAMQLSTTKHTKSYLDFTRDYDFLRYTTKHKSMKSKLVFDEIDFNTGRWDNQREYKMYDFALVGDTFAKSSTNNLVCLATQSSIDRLYTLPQVAHQWQGPMSVAVYVVGNHEYAILQYYVTYLRVCFADIKNYVAFHIAVPRAQQPNKRERIFKFIEELDCQYPQKVLRRMLYIRKSANKNWRNKNVYPQNHMRNLARKGCQNKFVFLTDIDIIPSHNIVIELNNFLNISNCFNRCAFVIPTFEIDIRAKLPMTKNELIRLTKKGLARPFHEKVFIYNQYATNFSRWLANSTSDTGIYISHNVTNFEFLYEPFYVANDNVPTHDERFIGYGFTRNSQVFEMYIAGYKFYVLSPVFTCHWGLQHKKYRPAWREHQNNENRIRFNIFKAEIFARYKNNTLQHSKHKNHEY